MKWRYHTIMNFFILETIGYFIYPSAILGLILAIIIAAISGHSPDFDIILEKVGPWMHRDVVLHSFIIPMIITIFSFLLKDDLIRYSIGLFAIGYGFHLLFDFFPKLKLSGFGLIHIFTDAMHEKWSLIWLTVSFIISLLMGAVIIVITLNQITFSFFKM